MKKVFFALSLLVVFLSSCSKTSCELIGVWKVHDVKTDFDEKKTTPQMLEQLVEIEKQNQLKFTDDSTLLIVTKDNVFEANWKMDDKNVIKFRFKGDNNFHKLGVYRKPYIITESHTKIGTMTTTYVKQ